MQLEFRATGQDLTRLENNKPRANSQDYLTAKFILPVEYDGTITAHFRMMISGAWYETSATVVNGVCDVPNNIVKEGNLYIGITGTGTKHIPTEFKIVPILPSCDDDNVYPLPGMATSQYQETVTMYDEIKTIYESGGGSGSGGSTVTDSTTNGNILVNGAEVNVYAHPTGANPHGTTKDDVGLGNVPNVTTNNQTPTYTEAATLTALTSGEITTTAFGKIAKAISSLVTHLADSVAHITSAERTSWNSASTNSHTHSNKTVLDNTTASYTTTEKNKLTNISSGAQVNNISDTNATDLTDGTDTTLHYHSADRNRANHTGTQLASTISDFISSVRTAVLTGLSTATNAVVSATDTVLSAIGKLQAQISALISDATITAITESSNTFTANFNSRSSISRRATISDTTAKTFAVSNVPAETEMYLELVYTSAAVITWFSGITWLSGSAPTLIAGKRYRLGFYTSNGTSWDGICVGGW